MAPDLSSVSPEQSEPWKAGQRVTTQQPNPFVIGQGLPVQPKELLEEHSLNQQESSALSSKPAVGVTLSPVQRGLSAQPPGPWEESDGSFPLANSMTFSPLDIGTIFINEHSVLPKTIVTHVNLDLATAAEPSLEVQPSVTQQEDPAQPPVPTEQAELCPSQTEPLSLQSSLKNLNLLQVSKKS